MIIYSSCFSYLKTYIYRTPTISKSFQKISVQHSINIISLLHVTHQSREREKERERENIYRYIYRERKSLRTSINYLRDIGISNSLQKISTKKKKSKITLLQHSEREREGKSLRMSINYLEIFILILDTRLLNEDVFMIYVQFDSRILAGGAHHITGWK